MKRSIGGTLRRWSALALPVLLVAVAGCDDGFAVTEPVPIICMQAPAALAPEVIWIECETAG
jgi:hypothetical protein